MIKLVRLFRAANGMWHYEIDRDGRLYWSSLGTRDEAKARARYQHMQEVFDEAGSRDYSETLQGRPPTRL